MLKKHAFVVRMVKDPVDIDTPAPAPTYLINLKETSNEQMRQVAKKVVVTYVGWKLLNTACEAALIYAAKK